MSPAVRLRLTLISTAVIASGPTPSRAAGGAPASAADARSRAIRYLSDHTNRDGGWPYRPGGPSAAEPTAAALMGLIAAAPGDAAVPRGLAFLETLRRGPAYAGLPEDPDPDWVTAPVLLVHAARGPGGTAPAALAARWLLDREAFSAPGKVAPGWPWSTGTAPWVEPTAMTVLALARAGHSATPRVTAAITMLERQANSGGGFSLYAYRPYRYHTALVLLALHAAGVRGGDASRKAVEFLEGEGMSDPSTLGRAYGLLAMVRLGSGKAGECLSQVLASQVADGSFSGSAMETGIVLQALQELHPAPELPRR